MAYPMKNYGRGHYLTNLFNKLVFNKLAKKNAAKNRSTFQ